MKLIVYVQSFLILILLTGCVPDKHFRYDLFLTSENKTYIQGEIAKNSNSNKPYYLVLYKIENNEEVLVDFSSHVTAGKFRFDVIPGEYRIYGIQEPNNLAKKKSAYIFRTKDIIIDKNTNCASLYVLVDMNTNLELNKRFGDLIGSLDEKSIFDFISYDKTIDLTHEMFDDDNLQLGLWSPTEFVTEIGGGLYSLNTYDSKKIPLLFVHGIVGSPKNFSKIIDSIDKNKYQVLVYYYATGANLNYSVEILKFKFDKLIQKYNYNEVVVIAHSMGGLVARGFINRYKNKMHIPTFITLATPWNGQQFAKLGGVDVGRIVPSFGNLYPGSAYQKKIYLTSLLPETKHYLFFGYRGKKSIILDNSNDGIISLSSQLYDEVQQDAYKVYGFNVNHREILNNTKVIEHIRTILE